MTRALLRDNNDAAIITPPRRRASHPDCRCIPILIVALHAVLLNEQVSSVSSGRLIRRIVARKN
jgi:hypothetical protein